MLHARSNQQEPATETFLDTIEKASPRALDGATRAALIQFVRLYFNGVPHDDLASHLPEDLHGAAQSHWHLSQRRQADSHRLSVFNPAFAGQGWQSAHTIIEIVAEDQPWLVSSLQATLAAKNLGIHLLIHPIVDTPTQRKAS